VNFLAMEANDTELRATLAEQASDYIRMGQDDAEIDKSALDPAFTAAALSVAVQDLGAPFAKTLFERMLSSGDARFREQASEAQGPRADQSDFRAGRHCGGASRNLRLVQGQ
jgi:hypothetical protein